MSPHYLKTELDRRVQTDPALFDFLQAGCLDGLWFWDLEAPEHEWMNERFWTVMGRNPAAMPHTPDAWQDLIHPEDKATALANFERHVADPEFPYDQVVRYKHVEGHWVWVRCRGIVLRDESDTPVRMLGAHTEVTQLVEANAKLTLANTQLKDANSVLNEFAWAASHDLRAPLRGIEQLVEWVGDDLAEGEMDEVASHLEQLHGRISRMRNLLDSLIDYVRVGERNATEAPMSLEAVCHRAIAGAELPEAFTVTVETPMPSVTHAGFLPNVILNLLRNAIVHHDRPAGSLVIRATTVEGFARIEVADDGPGIPEEYRERVFKIFEQLQARDLRGGSGMGLSIVRRAVERLGGSTGITDNTPRGTTVWFTWPLAAETS